MNDKAQLYKTISDFPTDQKPREKALAQGIKSLSDAELMAIIFSTGIKGKNVIELCQEILDDNDRHISKVAQLDVRDFTKRYKGIGQAKALTMLAALELGRRAGADALKVQEIKITNSNYAYEYMKPLLAGLSHEEFWILTLRQNGVPIRPVKIGQGGLTATAVDIKVILREALAANAPQIMLFHNHPSGNRHPSQQDNDITKKIIDAARVLDIVVLDHIIVANECYYSFRDEGLVF